MSKAYKKERLGIEQGSLSGPHSMPLHLLSPEEEKKLQQIVEQVRPQVLQQVLQEFSFSIDNSIHNGDVQQIIYQTVVNYITYELVRVFYNLIRPGPGITMSSAGQTTVIGVDLATNPGLQFDGETLSGKLEAKPNTSAGIDKDGDGLKVLLGESLGTTGDGGGLEFDSGSIRVCPQDFLYTG